MPRLYQASSLETLSACLSGPVPPGIDWVAVIARANQSLVAPRLYRELIQSDSAPQVDRDALDYLSDLDTLNTERNRRLFLQLAEIAGGFRRRDRLLNLMKGAVALVRAPFPTTPSRMLIDLDILIRPEDHQVARAILCDLGYAKVGESETPYSIGSFYRDDVVGVVDVHHRMSDRFRGILTEEDISAHMGLAEIGGHPIRVPDDSLRFVTNLCHDMMHDRGIFHGFVDLRYLVELIDLYASGRVEDTLLTSYAGSKRFALGLELQCRMASRLFPEAPFPPCRNTVLGELLHRRRLFKAHHEEIGDIEWQWILGFRRTAFWQWLRR